LISFSAVDGSFISKCDKIKLVLHGFKANIKTVKVNGKALAVSKNILIFDNDRETIKIYF
jgi:alpha-glucosidase